MLLGCVKNILVTFFETYASTLCIHMYRDETMYTDRYICCEKLTFSHSGCHGTQNERLLKLQGLELKTSNKVANVTDPHQWVFTW